MKVNWYKGVYFEFVSLNGIDLLLRLRSDPMVECVIVINRVVFTLYNKAKPAIYVGENFRRIHSAYTMYEHDTIFIKRLLAHLKRNQYKPYKNL
jgi:sulfur relay (sulfurtransferase) DsrF/TusC family protein